MNAPEQRLPDIADIEAAAARLAGFAVTTPLLEAPALGARVGGRVMVKAECLQRTGSFKFRGAYNALAQLDQAARPRGVVAYSSGNHAQGVAAAAKVLGMPATIVMPADAPRDQGREHAEPRRRDRVLRPLSRPARGDRPAHRRRARRRIAAALRRCAHHRGPGHDRVRAGGAGARAESDARRA